jgi:phospholipid transport system substrate-binding protein
VERRRDQVAAILRRAVDVEGTGRFILGRWWRVATPEEQRDYLRLFEETLIRNLAARFGDFQGVRFTVGRSQVRSEDDVLVTTVVERPSSPAVTLDWRVAEVGGQPRIVDLVAEGASLRLTQRSEYSSVITRNGNRVSALLEAMRGQIERMG